MEEQNKLTIILRYVVPVLVTINLFIVTGINNQVNKIDEKLFKHLTNDELHIPRSRVVTKSEFELYKQFSNQSTLEIKKAICNLQSDLKDYFNNR
jgi:hypothetical protein